MLRWRDIGLVSDILVVLGFGAAVWGLWQFDPRVAWVAGGGLAMAAGVAMARARARGR